MGCINSSNHRKKYLENFPQNQQQNLPPLNDKLSNKASLKNSKSNSEIQKNLKQQTSEANLNPKTGLTHKLQLVVDKKKLHKLSGQGSKTFSNKSTQRQKKSDTRRQDSNALTKKSMRTKEEEQDQLNKQQKKILQILKRSQKISRVYRKVCQKMMQHNKEQFFQQVESEN